MINFIFVVVILLYIFLILSFVAQDYTMGLITAFGLMFVGVYMAVNGVATSVNNFLTQTIAVISICIGVYILIMGTIEEIEKNMG